METNWREIIDMAAVGQRALTQIESIKAIIDSMECDRQRIDAICAILGLKKEEKDV